MSQAFLEAKDLKQAYQEADQQATIWKESYPEYRRLMDNGLMDMLDENLPEVNDGSLAAALFKLPKRVVPNNLTGRVKALNRDEAWLTELANLQWENNIVKNANSQLPFKRKWKHAVRMAAGFGGIPIINLFVERGNYTGSDFIVAEPEDVKLEAGKVSDSDSDVIWWDVYYTKLQLKNMIEQAKRENKEAKENPETDPDSYNRWNIANLKYVLEHGGEETKPDQNTSESNTKVRISGYRFTVAFQRGVNAPFYLFHPGTDRDCREWSNPDPTGDVPVHYLYCYQDLKNPYGVGIVKLAGGTQNVLDYMRQYDVLATQLGIRPPTDIAGDTTNTDFESMVYAQDAQWITGDAKVTRMEMANGVYGQLPGRIQMYKTSLNQVLPTGDTSATSAETGDPTQSKTPAGVKLAAANLSIDDEDFKDNLYITYAAVAKSMINTQFANMQGSDIMKLTDDERDLLIKGGLEFPVNEDGEVSNELDIVWDTVRAEFDFEVDPDSDKTKDDDKRLEGLTRVAEMVSNPANVQLLMSQQPIIMGNKELNIGELYSEIIGLTTDNDKILTDITPEDEEAMAAEEEMALAEQAAMPQEEMPIEEPEVMPQEMPMEELPTEQFIEDAPIEPLPELPVEDEPLTEEEMIANVEAVMQEHGVDEQTATMMLAAEDAGFDPNDIIDYIRESQPVEQEVL